MTIGIIDIGIGNLGSLRQALYSQGWDPISVSEPSDFSKITHLLLPGVGAFQAAMDKLTSYELIDPIMQFANSGCPILGVCLGMQLLATTGSEGGANSGLNLIPGKVLPISLLPGLRIPHVGWNEAHQVRKHPVLKGIKDGVDFYFVHSYRFVVEDPAHAISETEYGDLFTSIVGHKNVMGVQFHPEKSQLNGIRLLNNFCLWDGKC